MLISKTERRNPRFPPPSSLSPALNYNGSLSNSRDEKEERRERIFICRSLPQLFSLRVPETHNHQRQTGIFFIRFVEAEEDKQAPRGDRKKESDSLPFVCIMRGREKGRSRSAYWCIEMTEKFLQRNISLSAFAYFAYGPYWHDPHSAGEADPSTAVETVSFIIIGRRLLRPGNMAVILAQDFVVWG